MIAVVALAGGAVVAAIPAAARAQTAVNVSVDGTAAGTPLERVWPYHGFDEVNYATTSAGQALLRQLATAHTAPVHVRTHFLLNTGNGTPSLKWGSTNAYTEDTAGNPVYSWTLMDGIMDSITAAGAFPFTEIAFMPQALSTMPTPYMPSDTYALDGGSFYPPRDYTKWSNLIKAWATHSMARYPGLESSWLWELWNEPDIGYWHGTFADYAKLYDYTEAALHQVMPNAQLGGPAVASAGGSFLTQFLQHCATGTNAVSGAAGARLDLVSFHAKGGVAMVGGHVEMNMGNQLRLHQSGMNAVAAVSAFRQKPIYITEADPDGCAACPVSMTPADAYRNSPAYGAYEVAMMKRTLELETRVGVKLGGLLTWAFTFPGTPYFAGYRALTTNGVNLPVMGAFKLLGALSGTRLPVTSSGALTIDAILAGSVRGQADVDALATLNGRQVQVLVWNYHDDLVTAAAAPVQLTVKVPASFGARATVTHLRVDDSHGDAYTVWTSQGSPAAPSATQIAALQAAMDPAPLGATQTLDVTAGAIAINFDLPRFGISLVTLTPAATADGGTDGGADAAIDAASDGPRDAPADVARDLAPPSDAPAMDVAGVDTGSPVGDAGGGDALADATGGSGGVAGAGGGAGGQAGSGGGAGGGGGSSATDAAPDMHGTGAPAAGCGCAIAETPSRARDMLPLVGLAWVVGRRRRRRHPRD
jgi:xylan 1,4-beta-xylosidase